MRSGSDANLNRLLRASVPLQGSLWVQQALAPRGSVQLIKPLVERIHVQVQQLRSGYGCMPACCAKALLTQQGTDVELLSALVCSDFDLVCAPALLCYVYSFDEYRQTRRERTYKLEHGMTHGGLLAGCTTWYSMLTRKIRTSHTTHACSSTEARCFSNCSIV